MSSYAYSAVIVCKCFYIKLGIIYSWVLSTIKLGTIIGSNVITLKHQVC